MGLRTLNGDSLDQVMAATVISGTLTETYAKVLRRYRTCNIATKGMEAWSIKPENFDENYVKLRREDDGEFIAIPPELVDQGDPVAIEHHLKKLFAGQPVKMPKLDFAKLVEVRPLAREQGREVMFVFALVCTALELALDICRVRNDRSLDSSGA